MLVSENVLKWAMRFYPPFLFQGIWTQNIAAGFCGVTVKIRKSLLNRNYNKTIFGGTIFCAADPFYVILFHQILKRKGLHIQLWVRHASIDYVKPATCDLYFRIDLSEQNINEALELLDTDGKFMKTFPVKITNRDGALYAMVHNEIFIKKLTSHNSGK